MFSTGIDYSKSRVSSQLVSTAAAGRCNEAAGAQLNTVNNIAGNTAETTRRVMLRICRLGDIAMPRPFVMSRPFFGSADGAAAVAEAQRAAAAVARAVAGDPIHHELTLMKQMREGKL